MHIEEISPDQAPVLAALHKECFGDAAWSPEQIDGSLALETTCGWIAFKDDKPTGFILCQILSDQSEILTVCVAPAMQRRSIGEALMKRAIEAARGNLFLEVAADNIAAIKLYEKLEFRKTSRRKGYYSRAKEKIDAICYQMTTKAGI